MKETCVILCSASLLIGVIVGGLAAKHGDEKQWRQEAIDRGFAEYNQTNGNWQWKEGGK